jgi:L-fucose isomerase-like protein
MQRPEVVLVASGDLRLSANRACWPAQQAAERAVIDAIRSEGWSVRRGHPYDAAAGHGFISSQRQGIEVFRTIPSEAPLVVVEAVWQYSHHVLAGLMTHRGPLLTIANWSGQWPGLVGLLNLNASLAKAGRAYSTLWSADFRDAPFRGGLARWLRGEPVVHDASHVRSLGDVVLPAKADRQGRTLGRTLREEKAILGVFDEGCMGMYNAIIPDELLNATGVFKERLSQSALYAAMRTVSAEEARAVRQWLDRRGMRFHTGPDPATDLTDDQILEQCRMYIAALRIADEFGCDAIGIQYQQGLKDLCPASDLVEGLLNNTDRPPVSDTSGRRTLYEGKALPHFNEVDECAGLDALITHRLWSSLGMEPETTLHDVRYGEPFMVDGRETFVWVFEISGAVPPSHFERGYADAASERQPPMYFPLGGGTIKGVSKPGEIVWSRIFVERGRLNADLGRGRAVALPEAETERRWAITTPQWPIMHAVLDGINRDQLMARHRSNHIQVAYAPDEERARFALAAKAAMMAELGIAVSLCGETGL